MDPCYTNGDHDDMIPSIGQCADVMDLLGLYLPAATVDLMTRKLSLIRTGANRLSFVLWERDDFWKKYYQTHVCSILGLEPGQAYRDAVLVACKGISGLSLQSNQSGEDYPNLTDAYLDMVYNGYDILLLNLIHQYRTTERPGVIEFNAMNEAGSGPLIQIIGRMFGTKRKLDKKVRVAVTMKIIKILMDIEELSINGASRSGVTPLMVAAAHNRVEIALLLIEAGASIYTADKADHTTLHYAAENGNVEIIEMVLRKAKNDQLRIPRLANDKIPSDGVTELSSVELEQRYIRYVNIITEVCHTALHRCILTEGKYPLWYRKSAIMLRETEETRSRSESLHHEWLLNSWYKRKSPTMGIQYRYGYQECIIALARYGADPNILTRRTGNSGIFIAVKSNRHHIVEVLLKAYLDDRLIQDSGSPPTPILNLNAVNIYGGNLMMYLAEYGDQQMAELVFPYYDGHRGQDLKRICLATNHSGVNALLYATTNCNLPIIQMLLDIEPSADYINSVTNLGNNALHRGFDVALPDSERILVASFLIKHGIDINRLNYRGMTPLMMCLEHTDDDSILSLLLDQANIELHHRIIIDLSNALMLSIRAGPKYSTISSRLISNYSRRKVIGRGDGDQNCNEDDNEMILGTDHGGSNPLLLACGSGDINVVFHLVNYCNDFECMKIMLTQANNDGHTPLTISIICGRELIVSLLLIAAKNRSSKGCNGERRKIIDLFDCNPSPMEVIEYIYSPNPRIVRMIHEHISHKNGSNLV